MLCKLKNQAKLTHSAARVSAIYHIVIFERSHVTVRNTRRHTICSRLALAHRCRYARLIVTEC